uniref:Uncharacterized protein n=1 Tax=Parascaris equorum TaxID=6256 RepID=A0A914RGL0_PAREQ
MIEEMLGTSTHSLGEHIALTCSTGRLSQIGTVRGLRLHIHLVRCR